MSNLHNIFCVDDDRCTRKILSKLLNSYTCRTFSSGIDCLKAANESPPDLILLDVNMPEMDGYNVCENIKKNDSTKNTDVIFISANDTVEEKLKGYEAGGSDFLIKPFNHKELLTKVKLSLLNRQTSEKVKEEKRLASETAMTAMTSAGEQGIILQFLRQCSSANSVQHVGKLIINAANQFNLLVTVQFSIDNNDIYLGSDNVISGLEKTLLFNHRNGERILEWNRHVIYNYKSVSVLVKNMPEDLEKRGRFRDHLAILFEGVETRIHAIRKDRFLSQIVADSQNLFKEILVEQQVYKDIGQKIHDDTMDTLKSAFLAWELSEYQEDKLIDVVEKGIEDSLTHYKRGIAIDEKMTKLFNQIATFS